MRMGWSRNILLDNSPDFTRSSWIILMAGEGGSGELVGVELRDALSKEITKYLTPNSPSIAWLAR